MEGEIFQPVHEPGRARFPVALHSEIRGGRELLKKSDIFLQFENLRKLPLDRNTAQTWQILARMDTRAASSVLRTRTALRNNHEILHRL